MSQHKKDVKSKKDKSTATSGKGYETRDYEVDDKEDCIMITYMVSLEAEDKPDLEIRKTDKEFYIVFKVKRSRGKDIFVRNPRPIPLHLMVEPVTLEKTDQRHKDRFEVRLNKTKGNKNIDLSEFFQPMETKRFSSSSSDE